MNQLRVIASSCLHIAFLNRQKLLIAGRKIYGERMTSKKKTILERDQRFFVAAFFQKWIKKMLIRIAIFVWITLKYVTESTNKLLSLHLIVTYLALFKIALNSIVTLVSRKFQGFSSSTLVSRALLGFLFIARISLTFDCYDGISRSSRIPFIWFLRKISRTFRIPIYWIVTSVSWAHFSCIGLLRWHLVQL